MTKHIIQKIPCNQCQTMMEYEVFESVNVTLEPTLKDKIMNDELFLTTCPNCGKMFYLSYPFLYNDMDSHYMIRYAMKNEEKEKTEFQDTVSMFKNELNDKFNGHLTYIFRFVNDYGKLKEKIRIFDRNLDDRIIELYKYEFVINGYDKELKNLDDIIFLNYEGSVVPVFALIEKDELDGVRAIAFDEMEYLRLEKEYSDMFNLMEDDLEVDLLWAQEFYEKVMMN